MRYATSVWIFLTIALMTTSVSYSVQEDGRRVVDALNEGELIDFPPDILQDRLATALERLQREAQAMLDWLNHRSGGECTPWGRAENWAYREVVYTLELVLHANAANITRKALNRLFAKMAGIRLLSGTALSILDWHQQTNKRCGCITEKKTYRRCYFIRDQDGNLVELYTEIEEIETSECTMLGVSIQCWSPFELKCCDTPGAMCTP